MVSLDVGWDAVTQRQVGAAIEIAMRQNIMPIRRIMTFISQAASLQLQQRSQGIPCFSVSTIVRGV
jgi:hypothetical protein